MDFGANKVKMISLDIILTSLRDDTQILNLISQEKCLLKFITGLTAFIIGSRMTVPIRGICCIIYHGYAEYSVGLLAYDSDGDWFQKKYESHPPRKPSATTAHSNFFRSVAAGQRFNYSSITFTPFEYFTVYPNLVSREPPASSFCFQVRIPVVSLSLK